MLWGVTDKMKEEELEALLQKYKDGTVSIDTVVKKIRNVPYEDMGFAVVDHQRELRQGFPEVIYAEGKTIEQVRKIMLSIYHEGNGNILATRASQAMYKDVQKSIAKVQYDEVARAIFLKREKSEADEQRSILIMTAGTSDIPVAAEAKITAELMGNKVVSCYDVGVAGIHRLFAKKSLIDEANVIIVIAGMEGALASVVGGLTDKPIIAVPTSVGYGASFQGLAALLAMLNSCAAGVAVMNIDNGFGAGRLASTINHMR